MTQRQRLTLPGTIGNLELHRESLTSGIRRNSNPSHQPVLSSQASREWANHSDKTRERAVFIDKERT
jgi:hypothetical protein